MKNTLILLAGLPGTGKTYLARMIQQRFGSFALLSPDTLKETYCDLYGYNNVIEKRELERLAWKEYYLMLQTRMEAGVNILSDYPFSKKQKPRLTKLAATYAYHVYTIRLVADLDVLFVRQQQRDLDEERHLSHILTKYHKGDQLTDRTTADGLLSKEVFFERCITRGYQSFALGETIEIDVTDFAKVDYTQLFARLTALSSDQ